MNSVSIDPSQQFVSGSLLHVGSLLGCLVVVLGYLLIRRRVASRGEGLGAVEKALDPPLIVLIIPC